GVAASTAAPARSKKSRFAAALLFSAAVAGTAALGGRVSRPGLWYRMLRKPPGNPPPVVFGPVWTALYAAMTASAYRVWRAPDSPERTRALRLWGLQLALNAAWSPAFFGAHRPRVSLAIVSAMVPSIAAYMAVARKVDRGASALMAPYLAWTSFATYLNAQIVRRN
ncbi:MAG: TspO/MBR family protein, partial [Pseudomonadota bacterium]